MKVFVSDDFTGYWPVGTSAVVVSSDEESARELMKVSCKERGLVFDGTLKEIELTVPAAFILRDGNY
jgi:hypothetical protein